MRKTIALVLALVMIMSLATVYADAFTPPGQAKKNARLMTQQENVWGEEELEGWGLWKLPFGLIGKGVPPGLLKRGLELPPGLFGRAIDELPPGIQMRFINTMQERVHEEEPALEDTEIVYNLADLMDALEEDGIRLILLAQTIVIDEDTVIEGDFKTVRYLSAAHISKMDDEEMDVEDLVAFDDDWLFEVEDGASLTLRNVKLVGDGEEGDIGLVKVQAGAELITFRVWFSKAHTAVKMYVNEDVDDLTAGELLQLVEEAEALAKEITDESQKNSFEDITIRVLVVDEDGVDILEYWEEEE